MAIEEDMDEESGGEKPAKGKSKVLLIVIIVLLLTLLGVGGFLIYSNFIKKDAAVQEGAGGQSKQAVEAQEQYDPLKLGEMVAFEPFIVNLSGDEGKRFLKVTMQVELNNPKVAEELANRMPQVKDMVITVLSSKTVDEILTVEGKFKLKEQILTRINSRIKTGVVKNVYFVEFVIQ
ncbi:MAG: flagellar basal body-associated FliL family protein [Nitrospinota bacterium]|nr:flagellar basal body-associated FliL family protein [Nitrospinota bacterium]